MIPGASRRAQSTDAGAALVSVLIEQLAERPELARALAEPLRPYLVPAGDRMLDAVEAGEILRLHPDTVVRMAREQRIPGAEKAGRAWRFRADQLEVLPTRGLVPPPRPSARARRVASQRASVIAIRDAKRCT